MKKIILILIIDFIVFFLFSGCVNRYDNISPISETTKERLKKLQSKSE